jgi:ParB-like nuclease domain
LDASISSGVAGIPADAAVATSSSPRRQVGRGSAPRCRMSTWRDSITVHPLADSFPMMSDGELKELAEDIRRNGQQHPMLFATINGEKVLIDGRNRLEACFILDRTPRSEFVTVTDEATIERSFCR